MLRTYNYTKRKKILQEDIKISLKKLASDTFFNVNMEIQEYEFPDSAKIYIEAYYGPSLLRFCFGEVGKIEQPNSTNISEISKISDKVYFQIKIVDEEKGLILGYADKLALADESDSDKSSIFYMNAAELDTNEVWRVNFSAANDGTPVLEINNTIEGIRDIAKDSKFYSLVLPSAIRIVLARLAEEGNFEKDGESWNAKWINFTENVLGVYSTPDDNDDEEVLNNWYNDVVKAFCVNHKILEQFSQKFNL